ncbi:MAG: LptF/LptG family permease [Candidatus Sumerlaeia bacterium]|nr:LptF/LptG family permease [Candidatus Sumerlaeia bacterium]
MTTILQRYVIRELFAPVVLSALFFTFMLLLRQLFGMAEILLEAQVHWSIFFEVLGILTLSVLVLTIPMAALLGVLVGIGRMTAENEILAIRCAGIRLGRIFYPLIIIAFVGSLGLMYLGFTTLPSMFRHLSERQTEFQFQILTNLEPGRSYENLSPRGADVFLYYDVRAQNQPGDPPYTLRMEKVAMRVVGQVGELTDSDIQVGDGGRQETLYFSNRGQISGNLDTRSVTLTLEDGVVIPINRENREREILVRFDSMTTSLSPRTDEERIDRIDPRILTFGELREQLANEPVHASTGEPVPMYENIERRNLSRPWRFYLNARNEYYQRMTLPFSLLAFVLIAIPLAVELRPRAKALSIGIALGLLLLYYVMLTYAGALGMAYSPYTLAAYIAPNVLIGGIGLILFWRVQR